MARHFLRLKLRVFLNSFTRGSGTQRTLGILGLALALVAGVLCAVFFVASRDEDFIDDAVLIFAGAFGLAWLVFPVLLFGSDNTVDPMRFSMLPLSPRQLVGGQLAAGLVGGPATFAALTLGAAAYALSDSVPTALLAVAAAVLTLLVCQVASRAFTTSIGGALRSRKGRDFALLAAALLAASIYPVQVGLQAYLERAGAGGVGRIADVVAWLPFGWPFAAVLDARDGDWEAATFRFVGTALLVVALGAVWAGAIARTLAAPAASGPANKAVSGDLAPAWVRPVLPAGPLGAVVAKELRYWWRDPRRRAAAMTALFVGVGVVAATTVSSGGGLGPQLAFAGVAVAFFSTMNSANQFGIDGTPVWSNLAAPDSADADVGGRQLALALLTAPACLLVTGAGTLVAGAPLSWGAAAFGACLAALGAGLAVTTVISVLAPYAVPENPSNPFASGSGGGCSTVAYQVIGFVGQFVVLAPIAGMVLWGALGDRPAVLWATLGIGPAWGLAAALIGRRIGARMLARRGPDLLMAVTPRG